MSAQLLPPFLAACRGLETPHTPIWILRQAGRYLPEYRALREKYDFLTMMRTPALIAEATLQPIHRYPLDAAILFSDIMTPLDGLGLGLGFDPGPVLERPVRSAEAVEGLRIPDIDEIEQTAGYVMAAIRALRGELPASAPLICFAGAPFTLFCYVVEGRAEKNGEGKKGRFPTALSFLAAEPAAARRLLDKLTELSISYLTAQARAGAQALMLFDSWAGLLTRKSFCESALPGLRRIFTAIESTGLPRIYYLRSAEGATPLDFAAELPVEVVGIDERTSLSQARTIFGSRVAVQGNLAPAALLESAAELDRRADDVLVEAGPAPGHIFNLGQGIESTTDPDKLARLVDHVHRRTARGSAPRTATRVPA